jgi:hypothetical protein
MANSLSPIAEDLQMFGQEVLALLTANLVMVPNSRQIYATEFAGGGDTVKIPYTWVSGAAAKREIGGAVTASAYSADHMAVKVEQYVQAVSIDNLQRTLSNVNLMEDAASQLAYGLAKAADSTVAGLWNYIPNEVGTVNGAAAFTADLKFGKLNAARKMLTKNLSPTNNLRAVLGTSEAHNFRSLTEYMSANISGTADRATGEMSPVLGFRMFETQQIQNATAATATAWGTPLINKEAGFAIGADSIVVDGLAASGAIKAGSSFALGGHRYVVTADVTASSGGATLSIFPKLRSAVEDNDALTPVAHSAAGSQNFAFDPGAFAFASAPLAPFSGNIHSVLVGDPSTGLTIRLSYETRLLGSAGAAMTETIVADALFGAAVIRPDLAVRITGEVE